MKGHQDSAPQVSAPAVLLAVLAIGTCGLIYELMAGTVASFVLGDSIMQFSTVIGVYLFAMGAGAWLSGAITDRLILRFIEVELIIALIGGFSAAILFMAFARLSFFGVVLYGVVFLIGTLVGLEIPLLVRILRDQFELKDLLARVLTFDYLGALVASLAFPMFVVPTLGLVRGSFAVGLLNAIVAIACTEILKAHLSSKFQVYRLRLLGLVVLGLMIAGMVMSERITRLAEDSMFAYRIVHARTTPYQRLVVTRGGGGFQLYINGALQFSSIDEHRYHEALVHPPMVAAHALSGRWPEKVLILGGGDGLALRELLSYPSVKSATLVDLDPDMTEMSRTLPLIKRQNQGSLDSPRAHVVNADAFVWIRKEAPKVGPFDVIIIDFPDPNSFSLGKLYTRHMYKMVHKALSPNGVVVVQSTSPMFARQSFWMVAETMEAAGFVTRSYRASIPSFGDWGYTLAAKRPFERPQGLYPRPYAFLNEATLAALFAFPEDASRVPTEVNRLDNQSLVQVYAREWGQIF